MEVLLILDTPADLFDVAGSNCSLSCSKWEREASAFDLESGTADALSVNTGLLRDVKEGLDKIPGEETFMTKTMYCFLSVLVMVAANSAQAACTTTGDANNQRIICTNYQHSVNGVPQNDSAPPVDLSQLDSQLRSSFPPSFSQPMPSFSGLDLSSIFGK